MNVYIYACIYIYIYVFGCIHIFRSLLLYMFKYTSMNTRYGFLIYLVICSASCEHSVQRPIDKRASSLDLKKFKLRGFLEAEEAGEKGGSCVLGQEKGRPE